MKTEIGIVQDILAEEESALRMGIVSIPCPHCGIKEIFYVRFLEDGSIAWGMDTE